MMRFIATTCLMLITLGVVASSTDGTTRLWLIILISLTYIIIFTLGVIFMNLQFFCKAVCHGRRNGDDKKTVALTFDDGPDPQSTPLLIDQLNQLNVKATFFCVGSKVIEQPDLAKRITEEGHTIANHTFNHSWLTNFMLGRGLYKQIKQTQDVIEQASGIKVKYFRPPMGLTNPHFSGVLKRLGLTMVGWDIRTLDRFRSPQAVAKMVARKVKPGSIVLLHDGGVDSERLLTTVESVVTKLRDQGFEFVTVEQLINDYES